MSVLRVINKHGDILILFGLALKMYRLTLLNCSYLEFVFYTNEENHWTAVNNLPIGVLFKNHDKTCFNDAKKVEYFEYSKAKILSIS